MGELCIQPVAPIGKRTTFAHVNHIDPAKHGFQWIEVDVYPDSRQGRALRDLRVSLGLRLGETARALGIGVVQLSDLERGRATCDWNAACAAIRALADAGKGKR